MRRAEIPEVCGPTSGNEEHSGCSIMNIPSHLFSVILFRLPIKDIIVCKCTCKSWYATISNPGFANQHYAQSEVLPIARTVDSTPVSRTLYPLELEKDEGFADGILCQQCQVSMKLDSKLKIPVCNFPINGNEEMTLNAQDHKYKVVNSCNGFLCLSEQFLNKPVVVCNPVTGEFINLPQVIKDKNVVDGSSDDYFYCGFGFSPKTNQYKVVTVCGRLAQVHTLGTRSWKNIEFGPYSQYLLAFPTYLNGALHWICRVRKVSILIMSFDCEKECFLPFPLPPIRDSNRDNVGMGVLGGCVCICDPSDLSMICVWVMKNYGLEKSWTKVFEIDKWCCDRFLYGFFLPIKHMKNGALLMFNYPSSVLIYYDPEKPGMKLFKFHPIQTKYEMVAHTPSFISLEDIVAGCNVEVLNVYSRCVGLKLEGEDEAVSLNRQTKMMLSDPDSAVDPCYEYYLLTLTEWDEYWWGKYR